MWFDIGKVEEKQLDNLHYVIMIAIAKVDSCDKFRKDMYKSKRKNLSEIWNGEHNLDIANIVRFAPSACNTQPWIVDSSKNDIKYERTLYSEKFKNDRTLMATYKMINGIK